MAFAGEGESEISLLDTLWVMMAAFMVFFMNAGFALVEAGFCRAKNVVNILGKNFAVFAIATLAFLAVGYGFMFGEGNSIIGLSSFFVDETTVSPVVTLPVLAFFFFQAAFAAAGGSIVSGAVAERIIFHAYLLFTLILVAVIYPMVGHWVWGGGWLAQIGFHDFAGSTAVHSVGGWAALTGVMILGPRIGKFRPDGTPRAIMGHSIPLATLGAFILWFGWYGFNPGSELGFTVNVPRIALTTTLAASAGILATLLITTMQDGKADLSMVINGALAGLVAITAGCAVISPSMSIVVGFLGGVLVSFAVPFFDRLKLDDPVGALAVHLMNGIWGTLAVGIFAVPALIGGDGGVLYGGGVALLGVQALGVIAVGATVFTLTYGTWQAIKVFIPLRVSREDEIMGLDITEMGMEGYKGFQIFTTEN